MANHLSSILANSPGLLELFKGGVELLEELGVALLHGEAEVFGVGDLGGELEVLGNARLRLQEVGEHRTVKHDGVGVLDVEVHEGLARRVEGGDAGRPSTFLA